VSAKKPKNSRAQRGSKPNPAAAKKTGSTAAAASNTKPTNQAAPKTQTIPGTGKSPKPEPGWACESSGGAPTTPKDRFYSGLIAGIAGSVMVAVVIAGITAQVMSQSAANDSLKASQEASSGPVLGLDKDGKGSLTGWVELSGLAEKSVDATGKPTDIVGGLGFYGNAVEASITVDTYIQPLIAHSAKITREGKPWNPPGDAKNSAAWRFLNVLLDENSDLSSEEHTATIRVHKADEGLVIDAVDIGPVIAQPEGADGMEEIEIP
jgi:hypothetical protein